MSLALTFNVRRMMHTHFHAYLHVCMPLAIQPLIFGIATVLHGNAAHACQHACVAVRVMAEWDRPSVPLPFTTSRQAADVRGSACMHAWQVDRSRTEASPSPPP